MAFDKSLIASNFSRGSKTYDEYAQPQLTTAKELVELISPYLKKDAAILDLGSGTSFVAKRILECASRKSSNIAQTELKITEVDISTEMLSSWRDRPSNVKTINADFEELDFPKESFDLIISSFSLQWSSDFAKNFARFFTFLKTDGIFAFALPTKGSLFELNEFNINKFPDPKELESLLIDGGFVKKLFSDKIIKQDFTNRGELLKFLKRIGANSPSKTGLPLKRKISKNVSSQLSWRVSYFIFKKVTI